MYASSLVFLCALGGVLGMSSGPPVPAACESLTPQHVGTTPRSDDPPTSISIMGMEGAYVPGASLSGMPRSCMIIDYHPLSVLSEVNLNSSRPFMGFMIQVRTVGSEQPLGTFIITDNDSKAKTLSCPQNAVSH